LVLLAKSPQVAARYSKQLVEQKFHKVYLARVAGEFPSAENHSGDDGAGVLQWCYRNATAVMMMQVCSACLWWRQIGVE
jgi:23S rRNA-/tRNA-specific pseudouridylate synthase